jgi:hypothetical protein
MTPSKLPSIEQDVAAYEKWLRKHCDVIEEDLDAKHRRMRKSEFDFLRATYFRWARTIEALCPSLATAPPVLCIGDIHVENYGTWRDADARLVWGINDFDEAAVMPYAFDLVRLTTSAILAPDYARGLASPHAVLLDENAGWLRPYVNQTAKSNNEFWEEVRGYPDAEPSGKVKNALKGALPDGATVQRYASRRKGGGSLGRPRYLAIASWNGGHVVREAKALAPSAWAWAHGTNGPSRILDAAFGDHRSPDPHLRYQADFVLRRIAPDSRKIDIEDVQVNGLTEDLLAAIAADLAAVHTASECADRIAENLGVQPDHWLQEAVAVAKDATRRDFSEYLAHKK